MARRGLIFPEQTRDKIRKTGIRCHPQLEMVYQQRASTWKLRGEESGGAVEELGHYVGFAGKDGSPIRWLQRVQNFLPNGVHALVIEPELVRVEMFRYERTYDLLITHHTLEGSSGKRPEFRSQILYLGRNGTLDTELWGRDAAFRGGAAPHFFTRSGEEGSPDPIWLNAVMKATEGVCCTGCRHCHLLEAGAQRQEKEAMEVTA